MCPQLKVQGAPIQFAPPVFAAQLEDWCESGIMPEQDRPNNRLLRAILFNDLALTIALASSQDWELIRDTQRWLWNHAPVESYGSRHRVTHWHGLGGQQ
jgi:hypothetical protein